MTEDVIRIEEFYQTNILIGLLKDRGYNTRDRLFRKLIEEAGEYAEAIEYNNGSTRKVAKFKGKFTPEEKLIEEISDVVMVGLALARVEGLQVEDVLEIINNKLRDREAEYQKEKYRKQQEELFQNYVNDKKYWLPCPECLFPLFKPIPASSVDPDAKEEDGPWFGETDKIQCPDCGTNCWVNVDGEEAYADMEEENEIE